MMDFSFLNDQDVIAINNRSELQAILRCFEEAGICWATGARAVALYPDSISYIRFNKVKDRTFLTYSGDRTPNEAVIGRGDPDACVYTVSEALSLVGQQSEESEDFESAEVIDIREFLIS